MQPARARRSIAAVAATTAGIGALLVVLALVLSACSGSSKASSTSSPSVSGARSTVPSSASTTSASSSATSSGGATAPSSGGVTQSATPGSTAGATQPLPVQAAVPLTGAASFGNGVTATITGIEPITAQASLPGEVSGPAVRMTFGLQNGSGAPLTVTNTTVDLQDRSGASATPVSQNGSAPFSGSIAPGASALGVYVFSLAADNRSGVRVLLTVSTALPVAQFSGDV